MADLGICWVDGRLGRIDAPAVRADDSALREGRGCYGTTRADAGVARHAVRHARRLARDAARIGIAGVDPALCERAYAELAAAAFPDGSGVIRVQASRDGDGTPHLVGTVRALGTDPNPWTAVIAPFAHGGPGPWAGAKLTNHLRFALAADHARDSRADEAILLDVGGLVVEGARSNLVVVLADGKAHTPPVASGCVAGVAREIALERITDLREAPMPARELAVARELVALNGARGARSIVAVDGQPIGDGAPGPWAARLADSFSAG